MPGYRRNGSNRQNQVRLAMITAAHAVRRTAARSGDLGRIATQAVGRFAVTALLAFHAWLLWAHLFGGRAIDLQTAARWAVAVLVLGGFRTLHRRGMPLFWGRRAVVLWLLVVVLHCQAVWNGDAVGVQLGIPETIGALAQMIAPVAAVLGMLFLGLAAARLARRPADAGWRDAPASFAGLPASCRILCFSPRPPPLI